MSSTGAAADAARADVRELIGAKGHAVENALARRSTGSMRPSRQATCSARHRWTSTWPT